MGLLCKAGDRRKIKGQIIVRIHSMNTGGYCRNMDTLGIIFIIIFGLMGLYFIVKGIREWKEGDSANGKGKNGDGGGFNQANCVCL